MAESSLYINPVNRGIYDTPALHELTTDEIVHTLGAISRDYETDPAAYARWLEASLRRTSTNGSNGNTAIDFSLFAHDNVSPSDGITVVTAPINDCTPQSSAEQFGKYLTDNKPSKAERETAQPGSWRQIFKAGAMYQGMRLSGFKRALAVIYSPVPNDIYTDADNIALKKGVTAPYGKAVSQVLAAAEGELLRGDKTYTPKFEDIQLYAAGMGHLAVGAAHWLQNNGRRDISGLTLPNLIAGVPWGRRFPRYNITQYYGETPVVDRKESVIPEATINLDADKLGSESAMRRRQIDALLDFKNQAAMAKSKSGWIKRVAQALVDSGVALALPRSHNARITADSADYLPHPFQPSVLEIDIKSGKTGKPAGLMIGEYVNLGAVLAIAGTKHAAELRN